MPHPRALDAAAPEGAAESLPVAAPAPPRLLRLAVWLLGSTLLGLAGGAIAAALTPPIYRAEAPAMMLPNGEAGSSWTRLERTDRALGTWLYLLRSAAVRERALAALAGRYPEPLLATASVQVRPVDDSLVVVVIARAGDPGLASELATQALAAASASDLARTDPLQPLGTGSRPAARERPRPGVNLVLGGSAGLLAGVALAFLTMDLRRAGRRLPGGLERWL